MLLRAAVTTFQAFRRIVWFVTRPEVFGVHAVPLTDRGEVVLVRLTYARGWFLPGGGLKPGEDPEAGILRELREEIGLTRHASLEWVAEFRDRPDFRRDLVQLYRLRGVAFTPPTWSLEIDEVRAFPPEALPPKLPGITRVQLVMAGVLSPR